MDNKEAVLDALDEYNKKPADEVPPLLEEYLHTVARTGETWFPWCKMKQLVIHKLDMVMQEFQQQIPMDDIITGPNMNQTKFEEMRKYLLHLLSQFNGIPFTIQRICELVTSPKKHYKRTDKFLRGVEKNVMVVTTVDPFGNKVVHEAKSMVNGMDANGYSGGDGVIASPYMPYIPPTNTPTSSPVSSWFNSPINPNNVRDNSDSPAAKVPRRGDISKDTSTECDSVVPQSGNGTQTSSATDNGLPSAGSHLMQGSKPDAAEENSNSSCSSSDSSSSDASANSEMDVVEEKSTLARLVADSPPPPESQVVPLKDLAAGTVKLAQRDTPTPEPEKAAEEEVPRVKDVPDETIEEDGSDRRDSRDSQGFTPEDTDPEMDQQTPADSSSTSSKPAEPSSEADNKNLDSTSEQSSEEQPHKGDGDSIAEQVIKTDNNTEKDVKDSDSEVTAAESDADKVESSEAASSSSNKEESISSGSDEKDSTVSTSTAVESDEGASSTTEVVSETDDSMKSDESSADTESAADVVSGNEQVCEESSSGDKDCPVSSSTDEKSQDSSSSEQQDSEANTEDSSKVSSAKSAEETPAEPMDVD